MLRRELCPFRRQIKSVNRHLTFGINQRDLDVALLMGKTGTDAVQKPRPVLSYHLEQRARGRAGIIKFNPCLYLHLGDRILVRALPVAQHAVQVRFTQHDVRHAALEALPLRQVQFQSAKAVRKVKRVHHGCGFVGEGICFHNVHAPGRQYPGESRKQEWPIGGDQGQFIPVPSPLEVELYGLIAKLFRHLHVSHNLFRGVHTEVTLRKSFHKILQPIAGDRSQAPEPCQFLVAGIPVHTLVGAPVQVVRCANVELPDIFCLPRR